MNNRFEEKFKIQAASYHQFMLRNRALLIRDHEALRFNPSHIYQVNSLYFDTPELVSYNQKVNGDQYKFKLRLRDYGTEVKFLELKLKEGLSGSKVRVPYSNLEDSYKQILSELNSETIAKFNLPLITHSFNPTLYVSYQREAYRLLTDKNVKLNIDRDIKVRKPSHKSEISLPEDSVLEIKYVDHALDKKLCVQNEKIEFSKYQRGVEYVYFL